MTGIIMPKLQAYTAAVSKISDAADRTNYNHHRENARLHINLSLAFYQAVVTTPDSMMRMVSFEAALRELKAAADCLKKDEALKGFDWKTLGLPQES